MILSKPQTDTFWRLWSQACSAQGWTRTAGLNAAEIDRRRKEFLRGCGFESLTQVDRTAGFTRVLNELRILVNPDLQAAAETIQPERNEARVFRFVIREQLLPCLALYEPDPVGYLRTILDGKTRWVQAGDGPVAPALDDLSAPMLKQVLMTVTARLAAKRAAAGQTEHEMRTEAGVGCDCADCRKARRVVAVPAGDLDEVEQPF